MIHIACNIDDNYIMQCCTTLVSVMYNNRNEQITFHIIAEFLSNEAKSMLTEEVEKYNPKDIETVTVLKDKAATETYGEKGKNGVIIIVTKKYLEKKKK